MTINHEYILVALLDDYATGDTFTVWPLHVTLVTWFDPHDEQALIAKLHAIASETPKITSRVGEQRIWGSNTVNVIERTPALNTLHQQLLAAMTTHARPLTNRQYMGDNYTPHITHQRGTSMAEGSDITLDAFYLVKKPLHSREKQIVAKIEL